MRQLFYFLLTLFVTGCVSQGDGRTADSPQSGTIKITVDESFRPVIEQQLAMYKAIYPATTIMASYKPEAECLRDFISDSSVRLVIVTRGLSEREEQLLYDSLNYRPGWQKVASDAVAIVINKNAEDSLFTIAQLNNLLTGKLKSSYKFVFDGIKATSTLRFIKDSILKGERFDTSVVKAAKNSFEVLDYVANDRKAIGFVGFSWIGNPEDSVQVNWLKKVKSAYVQCEQCEQKPFVKPVQESIITMRYPLVRGLYYMIKENYTGLGSGFTGFLKNERGQLIFRRAYLAPVMDFDIRRIKMNVK